MLTFRKLKKSQLQKTRFQKKNNQNSDFHNPSNLEVLSPEKKDLFGETGWRQYKPLLSHHLHNPKTSMNKASIHAIAKKLIAREWARVKGRSQNDKLDNWEKQAAVLKMKSKMSTRR